MRFDKINRHIYCLLTKDTPSNWFFINRNNDYQFRKGFFKDKTVTEVFELYNTNDNTTSFWDYLQYIYDEQANWKDKRNIYDIWRELKKKEKE